MYSRTQEFLTKGLLKSKSFPDNFFACILDEDWQREEVLEESQQFDADNEGGLSGDAVDWLESVNTASSSTSTIPKVHVGPSFVLTYRPYSKSKVNEQ